jgi:histidine ammonia-lyase
MSLFKIKNDITLQEIESILKNKDKLSISSDCVAKIKKSKEFLDTYIEESTTPVYGVTTGFGSLYDQNISKENLSQLQENLLLSHACGMGKEVPVIIPKLMLLLKAQSLSYGHSGVQLSTVEALIDLYNKELIPVVYEKGSLGASGDLAPLSHLALPLLGEGEIYVKEVKAKAKEHIKSIVTLEAKEGLALINGTQFMSAYGVHCLLQGEKLIGLANKIAAMSIDAFDARPEPFNALLHKIRPHKGQINTAQTILDNLKGSEILGGIKTHVQDPYSFRCIPQVHGSSYDVLQTVKQVVETEINSVTDNPNIFPDENLILSGGNFHGQTLALHLDFLALAFAELASISERRIYKLIAGERGLPAFLVNNPGLNSGFMIAQYTAASIVNKNKVLCYPASADSIISSNGQEDHVSMGATSAVKCLEVLNNTMEVLAIELFVSAQALDFRGKEKSSPIIKDMHNQYRQDVSFLENDVFMHDEMQKSLRFIEGKLI